MDKKILVTQSSIPTLEEDIKENAEKALKDMGLTMSSAII